MVEYNIVDKIKTRYNKEKKSGQGILTLYLLLAGSIVAASFNSLVLNRAKIDGKKQIFLYNLVVSALWCVLLFCVNGFTLHIDNGILIWGIAYGVVQTLFICFKTAAMSSGPVSVTTLVGNCSILVSIIVSAIIWQEQMTAFDIIGLAALMCGVFLSAGKRDSAAFSPKWKIFVVFFFVFSAGVGLVFKGYGKTEDVSYATDMMIVAAIVMTALYTALYFVTKGDLCLPNKNDKIRFVCFSLAAGVLSCLYNRLNVYLSSALDAIVFFPAFNGGVVFLSALLGVAVNREKLSVKQIIGLLVGIAGIVVIGLL